MGISRRNLLKAGAMAPVAAGLATAFVQGAEAQQRALPEAFEKLKPLGDRVKPITNVEFQARVAQAQKLMGDTRPKYDALYVTPGSTQYYFTGIRWGGGERLMALTIPRQGEPFLVCPAFEEGRLRELVRWPMAIRAWQEDESPYALVARALAERSMRTGRIGISEATPYFFFDGLRQAAPGFQYASGDPITVGCRGRKTAHELELMALACEAIVEAYKAAFASIHEGMTQRELGGLISQALQKMELSGGALVLFGEWAALPHGTTKPQKLKEGDVVLVDGGTSVEGYASDVTRTTVLGKASDKVKRAFETVRKAQDAALAAAQRGKLSGALDDAARKVITDAGFGKNYEQFTHRLGHGIGLEGHEHPYLVRGSKTVLEPGMTFSNEPGIYVRGEYGVRCEDVMVIEENSPARLLTPGFAASLENPFG
ncbi:MAG: aminopeptidase P family protein [Acidobacteria bacterium]|nr:aminopeptidase P family protein [Acidobacteriota bacterium]MBI3662253.1 aminopeptidase P family protein [Acidobacteriota bacterium]